MPLLLEVEVDATAVVDIGMAPVHLAWFHGPRAAGCIRCPLYYVKGADVEKNMPKAWPYSRATDLCTDLRRFCSESLYFWGRGGVNEMCSSYTRTIAFRTNVLQYCCTFCSGGEARVAVSKEADLPPPTRLMGNYNYLELRTAVDSGRVEFKPG